MIDRIARNPLCSTHTHTHTHTRYSLEEIKCMGGELACKH